MPFRSARTLAAKLLAICCGLAIATANAAAENTALLTHSDPVALPGIGRIVFGFVVTAALACGIVYGMRRWLPRFAGRYAANTSRLTVQTIVQNGLRLHVVTIDQQIIIVAEGKNGIAMTMLAAAQSVSSSARLS